MFKKTKGFVLGVLCCAVVAFLIGTAVASTGSQNVTISYRGIRIVIDGKEMTPRDVNGNIVEPFILNGTTYLPVRAVGEAVGKEVYWDGPNSIVYLGEMGGQLEYPSLKMEDAVNIGSVWYKAGTNQLTDNYGNKYATALSRTATFESLLAMKYSRFKATVYVQEGSSTNGTASFTIEADGKIIYSSPVITKTSEPIFIDVDIRGCNDFKINPTGIQNWVWFGNAGFYQ